MHVYVSGEYLWKGTQETEEGKQEKWSKRQEEGRFTNDYRYLCISFAFLSYTCRFFSNNKLHFAFFTRKIYI